MGWFCYAKQDPWDTFKKYRKQSDKQNLYQMNGRQLQANKTYFARGDFYRPDIYICENKHLYLYAYPDQKNKMMKLQEAFPMIKTLSHKGIYPKSSLIECVNRGTFISMAFPGQLYSCFKKEELTVGMKRGLEILIRKIGNAGYYLLDFHLSNFAWHPSKQKSYLINPLGIVKVDNLFLYRYREIFKLSDYREDLYREMLTRLSQHWFNQNLLGLEFDLRYGRPSSELSDED